MTVYAITDTKKGRTGIAPTYLQTTRKYKLFNVGDVLCKNNLCNFSHRTHQKVH